MNDFNGKMKKTVSDMIPNRERIRESVKMNALVIKSTDNAGNHSPWKTVLAACMSLILAAGLFVGGTLLRNMKKGLPISGSVDRETTETTIATNTIEVSPEDRIIKQTIYPLSNEFYSSGEDSQYGVSVSELRHLVESASVFFADIAEGDIDQILPWDTLINVTPEEIYAKLDCSLYMSINAGGANPILYLLCRDRIFTLDFGGHPVSAVCGVIPVSSQGNSVFSGFFVSGTWGSGVDGRYLYYFDMETRTLSPVLSGSNSIYYLPEAAIPIFTPSHTNMNAIRADEYENGEIKYHLVSKEDPAKSILELIYMPDTHSFNVKIKNTETTPEQTTELIGTMETDIGTNETENGFWETETRIDETTAEDTDRTEYPEPVTQLPDTEPEPPIELERARDFGTDARAYFPEYWDRYYDATQFVSGSRYYVWENSTVGFEAQYIKNGLTEIGFVYYFVLTDLDDEAGTHIPYVYMALYDGQNGYLLAARRWHMEGGVFVNKEIPDCFLIASAYCEKTGDAERNFGVYRLTDEVTGSVDFVLADEYDSCHAVMFNTYKLNGTSASMSEDEARKWIAAMNINDIFYSRLLQLMTTYNFGTVIDLYGGFSLYAGEPFGRPFAPSGNEVKNFKYQNSLKFANSYVFDPEY